MVTMTHPDLPGQPIEVAESAVPIHRASGWRTAQEDSTPAPDPAAVKRRTEPTTTTAKE